MSASPSVMILWRPGGTSPGMTSPEPGLGLGAVACALSASESWGEASAVLVVRPSPEPLLGVIGRLDGPLRSRLEILGWQLAHAPPRYVGYGSAEEGCARLAVELERRFGASELRRFRYLAIPRGGLVVLGMLAYLLDLPPEALGVGLDDDQRPLVVVDDCALSGKRCGAFLRAHPDPPVIFAHLYSHPMLRAAIEAREERVLACVAADDLSDHAPRVFGSAYPAYQEHWRRWADGAYWVGLTDHLCFAWSEPDVTVWNRTTGEPEAGWRLAPGSACLKNRSRTNRTGIPVKVQAIGKGPLAPSGDVLFASFEGGLVVGSVETGEAVSLDPVAADMWTAVVTEGEESAAAAALGASYDADPDRLAADLGRFVAELTARGLLTRRPPGR